MKLIKLLMTISFISLAVLIFYNSYTYYFTILPHKKNLVDLTILACLLIYMFLPLKSIIQKKYIILSKIICAALYIICLFSSFGDIVIKEVICVFVLFIFMMYIYYPFNICKFKVLLIISRIIISIFFLGMSAFALYVPFMLENFHYSIIHKEYTKYINIIPIMEEAFTSNIYNGNLAKYMSEDIYNKIHGQIPSSYHVRIYDISELYQKRDINDSSIIYIDLYFVKSIKDEDNNIVSTVKSYQQITVLLQKNNFKIIDCKDFYF